jgi:hypothetical protein
VSPPQPEPGDPDLPGEQVRPVHVSMIRVVGTGMVVWAAALVVTLLVPALRTGERAWWPWCCVAGIGLGALGLAYLARRRGNAARA